MLTPVLRDLRPSFYKYIFILLLKSAICLHESEDKVSIVLPGEKTLYLLFNFFILIDYNKWIAY